MGTPNDDDTGGKEGDGAKPDPSAGGEGAKPDPAGKAPDDDDTDWKAFARKHERENRKLLKELEDLRTQNESETEKKIREAKEEGRREAATTYTGALLREAIRSAATAKLADPGDAVLIPDDIRETFADDQGNIDRKAIDKALEDLVKAKPYLAAKGKPAPLPGGANNGAGAGTGGFDINAEIRRKTGRR